MISFRSLTAVAALSAAFAMPALAQTTAAPASNGTMNGTTAANSAATHGAMTSGMNTPAASSGSTASESTYTTASNDVRASKVIGASVYNDQNEKIGTVDDLLMASNHDVKQVVLSVGGFLGMDSKLVAVSIDRLQVNPNRIVMSGATKDGLTKMPTYKFSNAT